MQLFKTKKPYPPNELSELSIALGYNSTEELINFYKMQNKRITDLDLIYEFRGRNLEDLIVPISKIIKKPKKDGFTKISKSTCSERYNNCLASAFATATLEHIGCGLLDTTVIVRLLCHSAVTAFHITANNECGYEKEDCDEQI